MAWGSTNGKETFNLKFVENFRLCQVLTPLIYFQNKVLIAIEVTPSFQKIKFSL